MLPSSSITFLACDWPPSEIRPRPCDQGLTLVHFPSQLERFLWDNGCLGGAEEVFMTGVEGVFKRSGDV